MQFTSTQPLWWLLSLLALGAGFAFTLVDRPRRLMAASFALRALAVVFLVLALCRPGWKGEVTDAHVIFLTDVSQSVDLKAARTAVDEVNAAISSLAAGDSYTVFAFGNGVRLRLTGELAKTLEDWQKGIADDEFRSATRLEDAILSTRLAFPAGKSRRLVLLTDGQETHGSVAAALDTLKRENVDVIWKKLPGLTEPEASITSVEPNVPSAYAGEVVRLRVRMATNQPMNAKVRILTQGVKVMEQSVQLAPDKENMAEFDVPMTVAGSSLWSAELLPEKDHFPLNNQAATTIEVTGKSRVLIIHKTPKDLRAISRALQEQEFDVDVRGENGLPDTMDGLLAFDAVILSDIPATSISTRQMALVKSYVQDFGGGLAMFGSENSYGLGGYYKTPIEEVLPLISRFEKEKEKPSLAMMLVIDRSGSMSGLPLEMARQAAKASVELLGAQDQCGVVAFDSEPYLISELRRASEKATIQAAIDTIAEGGGTDMYPAMQQAKQLLDGCSAKVKHMICLTDGQTEDRGFAELTQALADSGVTVSTVALGDGAAAALLQQIAEIGKGRFYAAQDPASVPQIFTRETMQASKSAIKEDVYAPAVVTAHPMLAGYGEGLPSVFGYVMTEAKPATQTILSAAETGDPLLATGRFGLGQGLCYTSNLTENWGGDWLAWSDCGKFWAQVLRAILRPKNMQGMEVRTLISGDTWNFDIRRRDPDGTPVSKVKWDARAVDENGAETPLPVSESGLGRYTAGVSLTGRNKLTVRLRDIDGGKLKVLHYNRPSPGEYRLAQEVPPALSATAAFAPQTIRHDLQPVETRRPLESLCYALALASALGSLVLRRI